MLKKGPNIFFPCSFFLNFSLICKVVNNFFLEITLVWINKQHNMSECDMLWCESQEFFLRERMIDEMQNEIVPGLIQEPLKRESCKSPIPIETDT